MPVIFNDRGSPTCCGEILPPTMPETYCHTCFTRYDSDVLAREVWQRRTHIEHPLFQWNRGEYDGIKIH